MERAITERPRSLWGWALQGLVALVVIALMVGFAGTLWVLHLRPIHAVIESSDCGVVVFQADGRRWHYEPDLEECQHFAPGSRWIIDVNDLGTVRPKRRE